MTGGTSGIGYEILKRLINYKCHIVVADIDISRQITSDLVSYFKCDISKKEDIDNLFNFSLKNLEELIYLFQMQVLHIMKKSNLHHMIALTK